MNSYVTYLCSSDKDLKRKCGLKKYEKEVQFLKMEPRVYLDINRKEYKNLEQSAIDKANESHDDEYKDSTALFKDLELNDSTVEFENGNLTIYGSLLKDGNNLGFLDLSFNIDLDTATEIVNYFMKKLGKLKTVLESTK